MAWLWGTALVGLIAAHVLASPTADSNVYLGTTAELGFFKRLFHGLVWKDSPTAMMTTAPSFPSTSTEAAIRSRVAESQELPRMNFSLRLLSEDLRSAVEPGTYTEGSAIHLEARLQAPPGLFPKIFVDECFGTDTMHSSQAKRVYVLVRNHGCLHPGEPETKATFFRKEDTVIIFTIPAFLLTSRPEEKIYIHCFLTAWSQRIPTNSGKKACYFDDLSSRWKNIDEPSKVSVCSCCDSHCPSTLTHHGNMTALTGEGRLHREVVGPIIMQKEDGPWLEENGVNQHNEGLPSQYPVFSPAAHCQTMKKLLLVSLAFVSSCVLAMLFVGALLVLAMILLRCSSSHRSLGLLEDTKEQPFHTELQTMVGTIHEVDETVEESNLDYCKLKTDTAAKP
ncbi:hypothetical protein lerEdw1_003618 [Lerista edwardsae]|nr:hypothetical protein lerEdw1_003618 [Lerista edwardsae]